MAPPAATLIRPEQPLFGRDRIPQDAEGPILSVSSISAIVIGIVLLSLTIITLLVFSRKRRDANTTPNATPDDYMTERDVEMIPVKPAPVYDPAAPPYPGMDVDAPPEYIHPPPPP